MLADRIVKRLHRRMCDIDHHEVGLGAWRDPPQITAAQPTRAADCGGSEDVRSGHGMCIAGGYSRQNCRGAQFLDEILRKGVCADAEIDPRGAISAEILQQYAAPRKHGRAVRHGGAGVGKIGEIVSGGPVQPGMMVEKNRVADDRVVAEHPDLSQPYDRRLAVPPHDFLKLDHTLRCMNL